MSSLIIVASLFTLATPAHADDAKKYGGGHCRAYSGAVSMSYGRVYNASTTTTASVECPGVHDSAAIDGSDSYVTVIDNNATSGQHVSCTLYALSQTTSSPSGYWNTVTTSSQGNTYGSDLPVTMSFSDSFSDTEWQYVACSLPKTNSGASYIVVYKIDEA